MHGSQGISGEHAGDRENSVDVLCELAQVAGLWPEAVSVDCVWNGRRQTKIIMLGRIHTRPVLRK